MKWYALLLVLSGCASASDDSSLRLVSVDASMVAIVQTTPTPIPINEFFEMRVRITDEDGKAIAPGSAEIMVDATMPAHRHGMNHRPDVRSDGEVWLVRDMLLHMGGAWVLTVDLVRPDGSTIRMQKNLELQ
ncbi:MAG: hypothetical protein QGH76_01685 [Phycisphaerales bacterium]|nr:hypothetical protein [Phycisphaerales bacterium]